MNELENYDAMLSLFGVVADVDRIYYLYSVKMGHNLFN